MKTKKSNTLNLIGKANNLMTEENEQGNENPENKNKPMKILGIILGTIIGFCVFLHVAEHGDFYMTESLRDCICMLILFAGLGGIIHISNQ